MFYICYIRIPISSVNTVISPAKTRARKIPYKKNTAPKIIPSIASTFPFSQVFLICLREIEEIIIAEIPVISENMPKGITTGTTARINPAIDHML